MLRLEILPAFIGDCLWLEYGRKQNPHRILIDTGTPGTYPALKARIEALPSNRRHFDLFVVTHIDEDHIGSAVKLLEHPPEGVTFGDVWFNGYRHLLMATDRMGERKAQELSVLLDEEKLPWNKAFQGKPVVASDRGALPVKELEGGMKLTVLSPYRTHLADLLPRWEDKLREFLKQKPHLIDKVAADRLGAKINVQALAESAFEEDEAEANGSSIAFLAEYAGRRILFGADAFPSAVEKSVDRLLARNQESRLALDAFKVCHHGSSGDTSPGLATKLSAERCLFSTNGDKYGHPEPESIARLLYFGQSRTNILFNYSNKCTRRWDDAVLKKKFRYQTEFPAHDDAPLVIDLQ
ncbi:MAG: MBL fold metallo-hydrolase [Acidobacteria bacterium]|nr:MBL fold metallo-hydrolase [Acidobacteriota bacterium]